MAKSSLEGACALVQMVQWEVVWCCLSPGQVHLCWPLQINSEDWNKDLWSLSVCLKFHLLSAMSPSSQSKSGWSSISCKLLHLSKWTQYCYLSWHSWVSSTLENQTDIPWMGLELFSSRFFHIHSSSMRISPAQSMYPWCRTGGNGCSTRDGAVYLQERGLCNSRERIFWNF